MTLQVEGISPPLVAPVNRWWGYSFIRLILSRAGQLVILLWGVSTLLFFLLRFSGDPATIMAGDNASTKFVDEIRVQYGLNRPLFVQYIFFLWHAVKLDFGHSLASGLPALGLVLAQLPWTIKLSGLAIMLNLIIAIPLGAWLGQAPEKRTRNVASSIVFILQGTPGFVTGLLLIQLFAVKLGLLPSIGSVGVLSWVLPTLTLTAFLAPRLTRVLASNVAEAMQADFVRTARAAGASELEVLTRHALPNALLGTAALAGSQLSYLLSGAIITETIFAWPGLGLLLIDSVRTLDFPVVQATVFVVACFVFFVNTSVELLFRILDPRLKKRTR
ncbi:MAG TPA: ABC transporter permease [Candidatus Nanopelagicaceae bacterium]